MITYFLIFPTDEAAENALTELRDHGFTKNAKYTAAFAEEGQGWLVVERADTDPAQSEDALSAIAARHQGAFDGYERPVP